MHSQEDDVVRQCAAREARARASRNERHSVGGQCPHHRDGLVTVARKDSQPRHSAVSGKPVRIVDEEVGLPAEDEAVADDRRELSRQRRLGHQVLGGRERFGGVFIGRGDHNVQCVAGYPVLEWSRHRPDLTVRRDARE